MTRQKLWLLATRGFAIAGLVYLYSLDAPVSLLAPFNKPGQFGLFLLIGSVHALLMVALIRFIRKQRSNVEPLNLSHLAAWLMFMNGALFNVAYAMGPPPHGSGLFDAHIKEEVRFTVLIAAAVSATVGLLIFVLPKDEYRRSPGRFFTALIIVVGCGLFLWTEVAYYVIRPKLLHDLLTRGLPLDNEIGQVSPQFEALGRVCFYWGTPLVLFIGVREKSVSRFAAIMMGLPSIAAGGWILHAVLQRPPASLMPFTLPAWVLLPTYWVGVYLLSGRSSRLDRPIGKNARLVAILRDDDSDDDIVPI